MRWLMTLRILRRILLLISPLTVALAQSADTGDVTLFEFASAKSVESWYDQNDTVMGGVSQSRMTYHGEGVATFTGEVSLENNGGFAQVRYDKTSFDLSAYEGLELRIRGDGQTYQLRLTTRDAPRIAYTQPFASATQWQTIRLPFSGFEPVFRGRQVADAPALNPANIQGLGLMISDKQAGAFELLVDEIKAY